ncbi:MAG: hypothetical protein HY791_19130 [Deltaproteobacteria bacterium]|nr:hypothetical protein [Deltaproteobacteria bacterium]
MTKTWPLALVLAVVVTACSSGEQPPLPSGEDAREDSGGALDGGFSDGPSDAASDDSSVGLDAFETDAARDASDASTVDRDVAIDVDLGTPDGGAPMTAFEPGVFVSVPEGRVEIGATFGSVKAAIGNPTRMSAMTGSVTPRSYEWELASGPRLVVWFADSDLSQGVVGESDKVLWIAAERGFAGRSSEGVGIGSSRAEVRAAYGAPGRSSPVADPPGEIDAWYTRGLIVAYGTDELARTITVTRAYQVAPTGTVDIAAGSVSFPPSIQGGVLRGSRPNDVRQGLGAPDGEGNVSPGGVPLELWSYAFIGVEVFFADFLGMQRVAFISLHAPFDGLTGNGVGIGSTRAELESHLSDLGFDGGRPSSASPEVICYVKDSTQRGFAATYSNANPSLVTTMSVGFPPQGCQ